MNSSRQIISSQINEMISKGQGASLLQKLEFDISISSSNELSNYIIIILTLVENSNFNAEASDLLIKKVLLNAGNFKFLNDRKTQIYEVLYSNRIWPFVGLSEIIRRLIGSIIYNEAHDAEIISKIPSKEFLVDFNIRLIKEFFENANYNIETGIRLLYNCWSDIELPGRKIILSDKAIRIYRDILEKDVFAFDEYLHRFLRFYWYGGSREWVEGKLIVPEPFFKQIFGSTDNFLDFIRLHRSNQRRPLTVDIDRLYENISKFVVCFEKQGQVAYDDPSLDLNLELHYNLYSELLRQR